MDGEAFAGRLIDGVVSSVCGGYFEGLNHKTFDSEVLEICVASVYSVDQLPQPALQLIAIFEESNYVVSETYPYKQEVLSESCKQLQMLKTRSNKTAQQWFLLLLLHLSPE